MLHQLTEEMALLTGYLNAEPSERHDKNGKRMVVLDVAYDRLHHRRPEGESRSRTLRLFVVVTDEYTSYARTLQKGDCIICVGLRSVNDDKTSMIVGKRCHGFIGGTGITRAWTSEAEAYTKNQVAKAARTAKAKAKEKRDDDKFSEIRGDWY